MFRFGCSYYFEHVCIRLLYFYHIYNNLIFIPTIILDEKFEFSHLFEHLNDGSYSIFQIYYILLMQCFVYSVLYFYLSNILPGPGGIKKSYLFFLEVCIRVEVYYA